MLHPVSLRAAPLPEVSQRREAHHPPFRRSDLDLALARASLRAGRARPSDIREIADRYGDSLKNPGAKIGFESSRNGMTSSAISCPLAMMPTCAVAGKMASRALGASVKNAGAASLLSPPPRNLNSFKA